MERSGLCLFPGCGKPRRAAGYCRGHYKQREKGQELRPLIQRQQPERPASEELRQLYEDEGRSLRKLAVQYGVSDTTIRRWLVDIGVSIRDLSASHLSLGVVRPTDEHLRRKYLDEEMSLRRIAEELGVTPTTVRNWLVRAGIPLRKEQVPPGGVRPPAVDELRRMYLDEELSAKEIAIRFGATEDSVRGWLYKAQIRRGSWGGRPAPGQEPPWPSDDELRRRYVDERQTLAEIATSIGVSITSVARHLESAGIPRRTASDAGLPEGLPRPSKEQLHQWYVLQRRSTRAIAEMLGISPTPVTQWLTEAGIDLRPPGRGLEHRGGIVPTIGDLLQLYLKEGRTITEVAARFGITRSPMTKRIREAGLLIHPPGYHGNRYVGQDGHLVRSSYERVVCDWLTDNAVAHEYDPRLPFHRRYRADFLVNGWYVEIWGVHGLPAYERKRVAKLEHYRKHSLPLIQFDDNAFKPERAATLDRRLRQLLTPAESWVLQASLFE